MAAPVQGSSGVVVPLQVASTTTGNGTAVVPGPRVKNHSVYIMGSGTTSGGAISIEEATDPAYAGTWSVIQSVNASTVTGTAQSVVHFTASCRAIRARVSSNITGGGSIQVDYRGETD